MNKGCLCDLRIAGISPEFSLKPPCILIEFAFLILASVVAYYEGSIRLLISLIILFLVVNCLDFVNAVATRLLQ